MIQEPLTGDIDHIEDMIRWLSESKSDIPQPASKTDIKEVLKRNGIRNNDRLARDVEALINRHILKPQAREEWAQGQKAPKYYLQLDDSEPKSKPIACDNLDEVVEWLSEDLLDIPQPASKTDIKNVLKRHGVTNNDRLSADCEALIKRGVLTERPEFERVAGETEPKYYLRVK